ncbi:MAG: hypothetical protein QG661_2821 [Actinomycetota bacterium]|nr:hypothetical protein [Actinomycetota bacterium]
MTASLLVVLFGAVVSVADSVQTIAALTAGAAVETNPLQAYAFDRFGIVPWCAGCLAVEAGLGYVLWLAIRSPRVPTRGRVTAVVVLVTVVLLRCWVIWHNRAYTV